MSKLIEIKCGFIEVLSDDLIFVKYHKDYDVELDDVKELNRCVVEYFKERRIYSITDFSNQYNNFSKEAQRFLAKEGEVVQKLNGSAVVINNLPVRLLVRFFMSFHQPIYPTKIFSTIDLAKEWIEELREKTLK